MEYTLGPDEYIVLKNTDVSYLDNRLRNELILTNLNLVVIEKGTFLKQVKNIYVFPLNKIKIYDGQAQAMMNKVHGMNRLEVYFVDGVQSFGFELGRFEIKKWVDAINKVVMGSEYKTTSTGSILSDGLGLISGVVKDTVKDTFGIDVNIPAFPGSNRVVSCKCKSCHAPLTGTKGEAVKCIYCDTEQVL